MRQGLLKKYLPKWLVFSIDLTICFLSIIVAYQLRFNFIIPANEMKNLPVSMVLVVLVRGISFLIGRTYTGILRYTSTKDAERIFITVFSGSLVFLIVNFIRYYFWDQAYFIPISIIIIDFLVSIFVLIFFRILVKVIYLELINPSKDKKSIVIFGSGEAAVITKRALDRESISGYRVIAFFDDDVKRAGKEIEGVPIIHSSELESFLEENKPENLIIAIQRITRKRIQEITDIALNHNVRILNIPPINRWINGELSFKQIKKIRIEDLLGRDEIQIDNPEVRKQFQHKTILITGAAGSIGSGIVHQLVNYNPGKLLLLDQAESPLYELENELLLEKNFKDFEVIIGDVCNEARMDKLFRLMKPQIVFHAAAYKHVPLMELNPAEAVSTNIGGTKILCDLAVKYNVEKFVLISTDKAVNPTNVMGASKRIAEIYAQSLNAVSSVQFITTRFGNVLGSNGSVIPLFRKQIEKGGPITVTHPEVTRYFMTIPEACQLVLEAGAMGKGGEIFIFDMGQAVKIIDLAKKMVRLSRLELGKDIQIVFTGLRPGEKLYEELLANQENTLPTHHPKIMIAKVREFDFNVAETEINKLLNLIQTQDNEAIVAQMKKLVPEYISNNSEYSKLDQT